MESQPKLTNPANAPKTSPNKESGGFFAKWRKKSEPEPVVAPEFMYAPKKKRKDVAGETQTATPEVTAQPNARRGFGKNVLNFLFGNPNAGPHTTLNVQPTPNVVPNSTTPEQTPNYQRASRMRRLARAVIANVLGVADQESNVAANTHTQSVDVDPLVAAANNLQTATNTLGNTMNHARQAAHTAPTSPNVVPNAAPNNVVATMGMNGLSSFDFGGSSPDIITPAPVAISERLDYRLRRLEASAETNRTAAIAATGLGVLAVLLVGAEYLGRKKADREIKRDVKKDFAAQAKKFETQQAEFNQLRHEHVEDMNRNQRRDYYQRLSTFTNEQATQTREVAQDLNQVTEQYIERKIAAAAPVAAPERHEPEEQERREWRPRQPESMRSGQERVSDPTPLVRVESAENTERNGSRNNVGGAGNGFFGGGGVSGGNWQIDQQTPQITKFDPNTKEARQLEALRKAQQKKLQGNAWLYGTALILALLGLVVISIFVG